MSPGPALRRRALLAGAAGSLAAASGCVGELQNLVGRERRRQLSLSIATVPASQDAYAIRLANHLRENLESAGIGVSVSPMAPDVLLREVLVNHRYDIYVGRYPSRGDPDELRTLLHSAYGEEAGWQNPFGFSSVAVDDLLEEQRTVGGGERVATVRRLQDRVVELQPFTVVAFADHIAAARTERFDGWMAGGPTRPTDYLRLRRDGEESTLRPVVNDVRPTKNWNPLAVEYRNRSRVVDLLYEPLVRWPAGSPVPWLARSVDWDEGAGSLTATVPLRETPWHDGEPVTPADVAFTYEFLTDTSLGGMDTPVPTPWRRGAVSLVDDATVRDGTIHMTFTTDNPAIARRALEVPILPEHVWSEYSDAADLAGIDLVGGTTEALVRTNEDPVGSGPLRFVSATTDRSLELETFESHFLYRGDTGGIPDGIAGPPAFDRAAFTVAPSEDAAAELLEAGDADATADGLHAGTVPRVTRTGALSLLVARAEPFYLLGYNCRRAPLSNQRFRRVVARHVDRESLVSSAFGGYADPAEAALKGRWVPDVLEWDGTARLSFLGEDGDLDVEAARAAFREAGYQYDGDRLVTRGTA
ncbi:ABC transporter substrate-binding protein [Natronomonas marina]|uniref:ABC transporter substrate-binding protein n=1 Tax=Natronomonas marina TaxID=2961939 RepID=UPI0020C95766|nr:ABC transporter substrate-binding protein [Natronomonas marina]